MFNVELHDLLFVTIVNSIFSSNKNLFLISVFILHDRCVFGKLYLIFISYILDKRIKKLCWNQKHSQFSRTKRINILCRMVLQIPPLNKPANKQMDIQK